MAEKYCNGEHVCGIPFATGNVYCRNCGELIEHVPPGLTVHQQVSYQIKKAEYLEIKRIYTDHVDFMLDSLKDIR